MANLENEIQDIKQQLDSIENTLKTILCVSLLPKDGPNWDYYEKLFTTAEKMITADTKPLCEKVKDILSINDRANYP